jgi:glycosyltransferase involved in cell wall biosynthesis
MLLKVAIIEPVGGHGGMDYYDFGLCEGLASSGVDVVLHTCDETQASQHYDFKLIHSYKGIYGTASAWKRGLRFAWGSLKAIGSAVLQRRKICHFHFFHVGVLEAFNIALAKLCFRKVVITAHDVESFVESLAVPKLARWVYRVVDVVIAHNQISKSELIEKLGLPSQKIVVIPHGNYLHMLGEMPEKAQARKQLALSETSKVLLFFGQIKDVKGLDLLLQAMPNVLEKHPDVVLLIAGRPWKSDFSKYENIIQDLKIEHACSTHIRFIQDKEVPTFYAACDLVVLPYRRIYQSGVLLMSMSYGRVTVSSDLPGMKEVVSDGETGVLFESENVASLSSKLVQALNEADKLETIEKNALELMQTKYDWAVIGKQTQGVYERLLHGDA